MANNLLDSVLTGDDYLPSAIETSRPLPKRRLGAAVPEETSSFSRAFSGGVDQLQSLGYGAGAVAASLLGADETRDQLIEGMQREQAEGEKAMEGLITNWEDVTDPSSFGDYIINGLGQLTPSILETTLGAIAGAAIGTVVAPGAGTVTGGLAGIGSKTTIKKALAHYIKNKGMKDAVDPKDILRKKAAEGAIKSFYAKAGAAATGYQMGVGDIYSETLAADDPQAGMAALLGVPYAALDYIMPAGVINRFASAGTKGGVFANAAREGVKSTLTEATTELGQEELLIQTRRALDPDYDPTGEEAESRRLNAFILGGLGGGAVGTTTGALTTRGERQTVPEVVTDPSTGEEFQNKEVAKVHKRLLQLESMRSGWETGKHPIEKLDKQINNLISGLQADIIEKEGISAVDKSEAEAVLNYWKSEETRRTTEEVDIEGLAPDRKAALKEADKTFKEEQSRIKELKKVQKESDKELSKARKAFYEKSDRRRGLKGIEIQEIPEAIEDIDILAIPEVEEISVEVEEITGTRISPERFKVLKEESDALKKGLTEPEVVLEGEVIPTDRMSPTYIGRIPTTVDGEVLPEYIQLFDSVKEREAYELTLQKLDIKASEALESIASVEAIEAGDFSTDRETYDLIKSLKKRLQTASNTDVLQIASIVQNSLNMNMKEFTSIAESLDSGDVIISEDAAPVIEEIRVADIQESDEVDVVILEDQRDAAGFGADIDPITISEDLTAKSAKIAVDRALVDNTEVTNEQALETGTLQYKRQIIQDKILEAQALGEDTARLETQLNAVERQIRKQEATPEQRKEDVALAKEVEGLEAAPFIEDDIELSPDIVIEPVKTKTTTAQRKAVVDNFVSKLDPSFNIDIKYIESYEEIAEESLSRYFSNKSLPKGLHLRAGTPTNPSDKAVVYIIGGPDRDLAGIERTVFHEVVGHYGLREVFGNEWKSFLERTLKTPRFLVEAYNLRSRWDNINLEPVGDEPTITLPFKDGTKVVVSTNGMTRLLDEYMAEEAANFSDPAYRAKHKKEWTLFKRAIAHIRHVLRKAGFGRISDEITDNDIIALVGESYVRLTGEGKPATEATPRTFLEGDAEIQFEAAVDNAIDQGATQQEAMDTLKASRTPFGRLNQKVHEVYFDKLSRRLEAHPWAKGFMALGNLPAQKAYEIISSNSLGGLFKVNQTTKKLSKLYRDLNPAQRIQVYEYFTTKDANVNTILAPKEVRDASADAKAKIEEWGKFFVDNNLLNESIYEENKGSYLPVQYLKYIGQGAGGTGKRTSFMAYLKKQKDLPEEYNIIAGKITDPEFLVTETIGTMGRDVALLQMFDTISKASGELDTSWILGDGEFIKYKGIYGKSKNISFEELENRIDIVEKQLQFPEKHFLGDADKLKLAEEELANLNEAKRVGETEFRERVQSLITEYEGLDSETSVTDFLASNYKKIPKDKRWGKLSNAYVRKEIYNDLVDSVVPFNASGDDIFSQIMGPRGALEKATGVWKQMKVPFNIPSWFRNFYGNMSLLDISTNTNSLSLSKWLIEEVSNFTQGQPSKYWTWAEDHGLFGTTYASQELNLELNQYKSRIRRAQLEMEKESKNPIKKFWPFFHEKYSWLSEFTGEKFGLMEGMFKTVKLRDHIQQWEKQNGRKLETLSSIERETVIDEGVVEANKAIFDYSKVPGWLRTARRTPLGSPFITFTYKAFPRVVESIAKRPQKFIKYAVLPSLMLHAWQKENNLDDEEAEEVLKKMPLWMQEKSSIYILPWKSEGKWQPVDFGYMFPWEPFVNRALYEKRHFTAHDPIDAMSSVAGAVGRTIGDTYGFLGGPIPDLIGAIKSNTDDFTGKPIVTEGAPAQQQVLEKLGYLYNQAAPSFLTSHGFLGKTLDHYNQKVNEFGTPTTTLPSVLGRAVGVNIYPTDVQESHRKNIKRFRSEELKIIRARSRVRKDKNIQLLEKTQKIREFNELLKHQRNRRLEYLRGEY